MPVVNYASRETHHQVPKVQCLVHFGHLENLHIVPSTRRRDGELVLSRGVAFVLGQMVKRRTEFLEEGDISICVVGSLGVLVVDLDEL